MVPVERTYARLSRDKGLTHRRHLILDPVINSVLGQQSSVLPQSFMMASTLVALPGNSIDRHMEKTLLDRIETLKRAASNKDATIQANRATIAYMEQQIRRLRDLVFILRAAIAELKGTLEKFLIPLPRNNKTIHDFWNVSPLLYRPPRKSYALRHIRELYSSTSGQ